jgi:organic hydroperoxide reductase OsmC/OhrA
MATAFSAQRRRPSTGKPAHRGDTLRAKVPGLDVAKFKELAESAKANCPVSKVLNATITLDAALE